MKREAFVTKGTRVRFRVFETQPLGTFSLAGVQMKTAGAYAEHEGTVTHVRGDHPTHPTSVRLWIRLDDERELGPIDPDAVIGLIDHPDPT